LGGKISVFDSRKVKKLKPYKFIMRKPSQNYGCYLPCEITQCYLPPDTSEHTRLNSSHCCNGKLRKTRGEPLPVSRQRYKLTETWKYAELRRGVASHCETGSRPAIATNAIFFCFLVFLVCSSLHNRKCFDHRD